MRTDWALVHVKIITKYHHTVTYGIGIWHGMALMKSWGEGLVAIRTAYELVLLKIITKFTWLVIFTETEIREARIPIKLLNPIFGRWSLHGMLNAPHNKRCEKAREKWKNDCLNLIECSTSDKDKEREKFVKQKAILLLCIYDFMRILVTKSGGSTFSIFNSEIGGKYIYRYIWVENTSINHVWNTCVLNQLILRCFACVWGWWYHDTS